MTTGRILLAVVLAVGLTASEVRVDASCPWEDKDGYTPVHVRIEALIAPVPVHCEIRLGETRAIETITAVPGAVAVRTILVPSNSGWGAPQLRWTGGSSGGEIGVSVGIDYRAANLVVLDPRERIPLPDLQKLVADQVPDTSGNVRGGYRGSSGGDRVRRIAADTLPDRWQGWPAWLTLLTTADGEAQLQPAQRQAIADWTRVGGAVFTTDAAALAAWHRIGVRAVLVPATGPADATMIARLRAASGADGRPADHPVPGTDEVPTGWFLTLAIVFAIIAGPLNLLWAMRRRRPFLLLVSTPLISIGTCILLIAIALLSDGIGRRRSAAQIVVLDQAAQRAAAFTAVTWFCGIAPGGVQLDSEDRALPMDDADWSGGWRRDRPQLGIDWRAGQELDSGWIPARVNRQIAFTQVRPERRRISIVRDGGGWRLGNGTDVAIEELHWCDASGGIWYARGIASGAEAVMQPARASASALSHLAARLGIDARLAIDGAGRLPHTFVARLTRPLLPIPGPIAEDIGAPEGWLAGRIDGTASVPEGF